MGPVHKIDAHHGIFRAEDIGIDLSQGFPAQIIVAVPCGPLEEGLCHLVLLEGRQHFFCIKGRNLVDAVKLFRQFPLGLLAQGANAVTDL